METRERVKQLIDDMTDEEVQSLERMLTRMHEDPALHAWMSAPEDDEAESPEEREAVEEGRDALARGDVYDDETIRRELEL